MQEITVVAVLVQSALTLWAALRVPVLQGTPVMEEIVWVSQIRHVYNLHCVQLLWNMDFLEMIRHCIYPYDELTD